MHRNFKFLKKRAILLFAKGEKVFESYKNLLNISIATLLAIITLNQCMVQKSDVESKKAFVYVDEPEIQDDGEFGNVLLKFFNSGDTRAKNVKVKRKIDFLEKGLTKGDETNEMKILRNNFFRYYLAIYCQIS
jgi:hypothetical protein